MSHYDTPPPPHRSTADWPAIARSAAERLLGEPNSRLCNGTELRWGTKGSFALNVAQGRWTDFEAGTRGGALDLVQRETGLDRAGAVSWLRDQGLLDDNRSWQPSPRRPSPGASDPSGEKRSYSLQMARTLWEASVPIPADPDHPARRWAAERNLSRPEFPFPDPVRWVSATAGLFRGQHQGAGSLVTVLAPPQVWGEAWPSVPTPMAVSLVSIDEAGKPALDRPEEYRGLAKRSWGTMRGSVLILGRPAPEDSEGALRQVEGLADALAVAARVPGPVMASIGTPARLASDDQCLPWIEAHARHRGIVVLADRDHPGQKAGSALRSALLRRGVPLMKIQVHVPPEGPEKDSADVSKNLPFPPLPAAWQSYAETLLVMHPDWPQWEAWRLADVESQ